MELKTGTYTFGPGDGELFVKTRRGGVAFLVGKDLTIEVTDWEGKLEVGEDPSDTRVELTADGGSLKVTDGKGGPVTLTELDKKSLSKTVNEKVLEGAEIKFRSDAARPSDDGSCIHLSGELQIFDEKTSLEFRLTIEDEEDEDEEDEDEDQGQDEDEDDEEEDGSSSGEGAKEADERKGDDSDEPENDGEAEEAQSQSEEERAEARAGDDSEGSSADDATSEHDNASSEEESAPEDDDEATDEQAEPSQERRISGRAVFKQTEVGLEPHSTLLGLLRARDEVEVTFEGKLEM